jgi:hypothetical protein
MNRGLIGLVRATPEAASRGVGMAAVHREGIAL